MAPTPELTLAPALRWSMVIEPLMIRLRNADMAEAAVVSRSEKGTWVVIHLTHVRLASFSHSDVRDQFILYLLSHSSAQPFNFVAAAMSAMNSARSSGVIIKLASG
jgi:hypothetical protein